MMFPSVFGENLFDEWMDDFGFRDNFFSGKNPLYGKHAKNIMKTYLMSGWMILDSEIISLAERTLFMANMQKIS